MTRIQPNHFVVSIILGLAVANSFAYITSCIPQSEILEEQFRTTATKAQWGIVLSTLGLGLGTIPTFGLVHCQLRAKYIIAASSLLLSFCAWAPMLFPELEVILIMRLIGGIWGAVPIYTALLMFACTFDGLVGTNKAIIAFATIGGLGAGPIIGSVSPNFFGYSSIIVAILAITIPNDCILECPCSHENPKPESPVADTNLPNKSPSFGATGLFLGWASLCFIFQNLRVPKSVFVYYHGSRGLRNYLPQSDSDAVMPYCGIVLGAAVAAYTYRGDFYYKNGEKTSVERSDHYYLLEIAGIVISLQGFIWLIWDIRVGNLEHYYYYVLTFFGLIFGACTTAIAADVLAVQVDRFVLEGVPATFTPAMEFIVGSCLLFVLLGLIARFDEAGRFVLFLLLDVWCWIPGSTVTLLLNKEGAPHTDEEIEMESSQPELEPSGADERITRLEEENKALREELASARASRQ